MDQSRTSQGRQTKRWSLWASQWLEMLLSCVPVIAKMPLSKGARLWLDRRLSDVGKLVAFIVMIRAAHQQQPASNIRDRRAVLRANLRDAKAGYYGQTRDERNLRATMGGRLRRALKARGSLQQRAQKMLRALRRQDQLLARFVRRMQRKGGLSRRMSLHSRVADTLPLHRPQAGGPPPQNTFGEELRVADTS